MRGAMTIVPAAQSPRVGLMRHVLLEGNQQAAVELSRAIERPSDARDPWWVSLARRLSLRRRLPSALGADAMTQPIVLFAGSLLALASAWPAAAGLPSAWTRRGRCLGAGSRSRHHHPRCRHFELYDNGIRQAVRDVSFALAHRRHDRARRQFQRLGSMLDRLRRGRR
jgi:hypothetical protein